MPCICRKICSPGDLVRAKTLKDTVLHSLLSAVEWNYVFGAYTFGDF